MHCLIMQASVRHETKDSNAVSRAFNLENAKMAPLRSLVDT